MKKKICFLFNNIKEYNFKNLVKLYLPKKNFDISLSTVFPKNFKSFDLIIPWSYKKIIKGKKKLSNTIIIHSSNLPKGRGWAPIYHSVRDGHSDYTISSIFASKDVDKGNIIVKASFPILPEYTAKYLREVDTEISILLIRKIFDKWQNSQITSKKQIGIGSYHPRRFPKDNEVKINYSLKKILPHIRAVENNNPAFFYFKNVKYIIKVYPENEPDFPKKIKIEYPGINEIEYWTKSHD